MFIFAEVVCEFLLFVYPVDLTDFCQFVKIDIKLMNLFLFEFGFYCWIIF